jgi:hypothetical protein
MKYPPLTCAKCGSERVWKTINFIRCLDCQQGFFVGHQPGQRKKKWKAYLSDEGAKRRLGKRGPGPY